MQPENAPQRTIMRFPIPVLRDVSRDVLLRVEMSLRDHPNLNRLSVLPPPEFLTEDEALQQQVELQRERLIELQAQPMMQLDLTREDQPAAIQDLLTDRFNKNHGVGPEIAVVAAALKHDESYAWTWHCTLVGAIVTQGGNVAMANRAAATFLKLLADVDTTTHPHYAQTQPVVGDVKFEDRVQVAHSREQFYLAYYQFAIDIAVDHSLESDVSFHSVVPSPAGFGEIDQGQIQYPVAFRFGHSGKSGDPIVVSYISQGFDVTAQGIVVPPVEAVAA